MKKDLTPDEKKAHLAIDDLVKRARAKGALVSDETIPKTGTFTFQHKPKYFNSPQTQQPSYEQKTIF